VCARNISAGGLSAIHGGYIHPGSECKIVLPRREGSPFAVTGVIVHCRHIEGSYHEIGIRFTQEVDPAALVPQMIPDGEGDADPDSDMPALEGRILVVDQSPADRKLMTHHLSGTALILKMVSSSGAAIDAVQKHNFDLILCDLHIENDAVRMIKKIRSSKYKGPIIVVTAESSAARLTEARAAGANEIIGKPHSAAYLASLLAEWLDIPGVDRPIYSNLEETAGMGELIADFVDDVQKKTHYLEKVIASTDMTAARELCVELVGSGTGFGFASITEAARDALTAIDTAQNKQDAASSLKRLVAICQRLRCGNSARPMGDGWKQSA
jgi:CheY-like chemotaxis protein